MKTTTRQLMTIGEKTAARLQASGVKFGMSRKEFVARIDWLMRREAR